MSKENALQVGLFNQELIDTRTKTQKKKAKIREALQGRPFTENSSSERIGYQSP